MRERSFASWVAPIASILEQDRRVLLDFVRAAPHDLWTLPAIGADVWTRRDVLAHLAGGNDRMVQTVLRAVIERLPLGTSALDPDTHAENARGVAARRAWSIERLVATLEADGEEMLELLAALSENDQTIKPGGASWTIGEMLRIVAAERHDMLHLAQMRDQAL